ncbi:unnamed protein product [Calicophoron daubneyi]|uniref:Origin recognition complex subunit 3 n=1 Tax=Calicophoron daubneyi TaxID=300641 RepID=A0AAV2TKC6_CALDB
MEKILAFQAPVKGSSLKSKPVSRGHELFADAWKTLVSEIESKQKLLSSEIFNDLRTFIDGSYQQWLRRSFDSAPDAQIPTALLLAGVNTPDHFLLYTRIRAFVLKSHGCLAVVNPGSNTLSLRALTSSVVRQMTTGSSDKPDLGGSFYCDESEHEEDPSLAVGEEKLTLDDVLGQIAPSVRLTYLALTEWYHAKVASKRMVHRDDPTKPDSTTPHFRRSLSHPDNARRARPSLFTHRSVNRTVTTRRFTERQVLSNRKKITVKAESRSPSSSPSPVRLKKSPDIQDEELTKLDDRSTRGPLVIILPQVESIPSQVLQDFIQLTSIYASGGGRGPSYSLPLCLVFGLSTTPEAGLETRLTASTLGRLAMQRFTVPPPATFLESVLTQLIEFPGFHLSKSVLNYLLDSVFLCMDYSVQNFIQRVKFCMLEHYLRCPHPELMLPPDQARKHLSSLSVTELANTITLCYPSLADVNKDGRDVNSPPRLLSPEREHLSAGSRSILIDRIMEKIEMHWTVQYLVPHVLRWLMVIASPLANNPLGKSFSDIYRVWLGDNLAKSERYLMMINLLQGLSMRTMVDTLRAASGLLRFIISSSSPVRVKRPHVGQNNIWPSKILSVGQMHLASLAAATSKWADELEQAGTDISNNRDSEALKNESFLPSTATPPSTPVSCFAQKLNALDGKRKLSLRGLRQQLQEIAAVSPARRTIYQSDWEKKKLAFFNWLALELTELIPTPFSLPLHELFYGPYFPTTDGVLHHAIRQRLNPSQQRCLHKALVDPGSYLQIQDLTMNSPDCLDKSLSDLCILYRLHLESSKMINLYDWLMAFATVLGEEVRRDHPPSRLTQVRFLHGVAQLHYLGCIKSTRRKADHVQRLNWNLFG